MSDDRWEYRIEEVKRGFWLRYAAEPEQARLNQWGMAGWELVQVQFNRLDLPARYFLKRRRPR